MQTVAGSTKARRPSPGRSLGAAAATKAAPNPAVAEAWRARRRLPSSCCNLRRSVAGSTPNSIAPIRVNGGFIIAKSRLGRRAVMPSATPCVPLPLPDTFCAPLVAIPVASGDRANCTTASSSPRKSREPSATLSPDAPRGITYRFIRSNCTSGLSIARLVAAKWMADSCTS